MSSEAPRVGLEEVSPLFSAVQEGAPQGQRPRRRPRRLPFGLLWAAPAATAALERGALRLARAAKDMGVFSTTRSPATGGPRRVVLQPPASPYRP